MASRDRARRFLEESEAHRHYSGIIDCTLTYFIAKAETEGKARLAADLREAKQSYHRDFQQAVGLTEQVYAETFTDEEIDDLIILHSNPALRKSRALTSEIFNRILKDLLVSTENTEHREGLAT